MGSILGPAIIAVPLFEWVVGGSSKNHAVTAPTSTTRPSPARQDVNARQSRAYRAGAIALAPGVSIIRVPPQDASPCGDFDHSCWDGQHSSMARTTITQITDDIDGSKDAEEVRFSFADSDFVIDLSKKNRTAFEKALKPYVDAARRAPRSPQRRRNTSAKSSAGRDLNSVRIWAREQGIDVSERGRIAAAVIAQYDEAH